MFEYCTGICTSGTAEHELHAILNAYCRICLFSRIWVNLNVKLIVLKSSLYRNSEISYLWSALHTKNWRLWFKAWELVSTEWSELWPLSGDNQVPGAGHINFLTTAEIWSLMCTHNEGWDFQLSASDLAVVLVSFTCQKHTLVHN